MTDALNKPWIGKDGKHLPTDEIKTMSSGWDQPQWEEYLQSIEGTINEELIDSASVKDSIFKNAPDHSFENYIFAAKNEANIKFENEIKKILTRNLSELENEIVWQRYWMEYTQEEIAENLKLSRWAVRRTLDRVHKKLKKKIFFKQIKKTNLYRWLDDENL